MTTRALAAIAVAWLSMPASASPPATHATLTPDGQYSLILQAHPGWTGAEIHVRGGDSIDLGPAERDQRVRVEGWTSATGPLFITLNTAGAEGQGVTWMFQVEPDRVPVAAPDRRRLPRRKRGLFGRWKQ